jgi:quercetin dioxygenase-like cupin family protein
MSAFDDLKKIGPQDIWSGVVVRAVHGERVTFGVVELGPNAVVPEHHHDNEQLGMVLEGSVTFRIGDETRELGPGGTWSIPSHAPHEVKAGPEGAVVADLFAPGRADWQEIEPAEPRSPNWPPPS